MQSLKDHNVYVLKKGHTLDDDDPPVTDIITLGLQQLTDSSKKPLDEYNDAFRQLQTRQKLPLEIPMTIFHNPTILHPTSCHLLPTQMQTTTWPMRKAMNQEMMMTMMMTLARMKKG